MTQKPDHFKQAADGEKYAGDHLLVEFWIYFNSKLLKLLIEYYCQSFMN